MRFNPKLHLAANKGEREAERQRNLSAPPGTPPVGTPGGARTDPELAELERLEAQEAPDDPH